MKEIKRVAAYYRVSTEDQAQRGTIEAQRFKCREYSGKQAWEIVEEYEDPGVSGTVPIKDCRQGHRLMDAIQKKRFDALAVVHTDRLTRGKLKEFGEIFGTLEEAQVMLVSIDEGGVVDPTEIVGQFQGFISSRFAKKYRDDQLIKQQDGRYRASREGRYSAGQVNYGMEWDKVNKKWVVNELEYETLKEIRRLVLAGVVSSEIANSFNSDPDKYPPKYANRWTDSKVFNKLQSDFLFTGERAFKVGKEEWRSVKIIDPPLFTKDEVMEVRLLLKRKRRVKPKREGEVKRGRFLLSFIAECGCGEKLYTQDFNPRGKDYTYYRCRHPECKLRIDSKQVDARVWKMYTEIVTNPKALKQAVVDEDFIVNKSRSDLKKLRDSSAKRLEEIAQQLDKLSIVWTKGRLSDEGYEAEVGSLETEQAQVEKDLRRAINSLNEPERRDLVIKRAAEELLQRVERLEALKRINDPDISEEEKEGAYALLKEAMIKGHNKGTPEEVEEAIFAHQKKLLNDLIVAGGRIVVSSEMVVVYGVVKTGDDEFSQDILGQTTFG